MNLIMDAEIRENIKTVRTKVKAAAEKSGRDFEDIMLIAVSKTIEPERIKIAVNNGIADLGENRAQELCEKYGIIDKRCRWHMIGHLQTNKVKYIIGKVHMIHSVDSMQLVNEIQKQAVKTGRIAEILVQVNVAEEESKYGLECREVMGFMKTISSFDHVKVRGLMTLAPFVENPEEIRGVFSELRKISVDIRKENIDNINMDFLSMGMSNDFEVAIEEGANMVRIGTAIFGRRLK